MRKSIIPASPQEEKVSPSIFFDLDQLAQIEITSEHPEHAIECALTDGGDGWQAGTAGKQTLRIIFDAPVDVRHILLIFDEPEHSRTQEFLLRWLMAEQHHYQDILRQQFNFSPPETTQEIEQYEVDLKQLKILELIIKPDLSGHNRLARLKMLRLG